MDEYPGLASERWCYLMARSLLQLGQHDRALMVIGELLQSDTGRPHALLLLAEINGRAAPLANTVTLGHSSTTHGDSSNNVN